MRPRAAGYIRVSTEEQSVEERHVSLAVQEHAIRGYCEAHGYELTDLYRDVQSGRRADRLQYQQMLAAAGAGFERLIVYRLDRFSRDNDETQLAIITLRRRGVRVEATDDMGDPETILGRAMRYFQGLWAEMESETMGHRIRDAMAHRYQSDPHFGRAPYGWQKVDGRLEIHEVEAGALRRMVALLIDGGLSLLAAVTQMNEEGYRRRSGKPWTRGTAMAVLTRERNRGAYTWGLRYIDRVKKLHDEPRPGTEPFRIEGLPPLWDEDTEQRLRARFDVLSVLPRGRSQASAYLLSGLLYCGKCDGRMRGGFTRGPGKRYHIRYYTCGTRADSGLCGYNYQNADRLEAAVLDALAPAADALLARALLPPPEPPRDYRGEIALARRDLAAVAAELLEHWSAHRRGLLSERQVATLNAGLDERQEALEQRLAALGREQAESSRRHAAAAALPEQVAGFLDAQAALPVTERKAALQAMVERVTVWADHQIEIRWRV